MIFLHFSHVMMKRTLPFRNSLWGYYVCEEMLVLEECHSLISRRSSETFSFLEFTKSKELGLCFIPSLMVALWISDLKNTHLLQFLTSAAGITTILKSFFNILKVKISPISSANATKCPGFSVVPGKHKDQSKYRVGTIQWYNSWINEKYLAQNLLQSSLGHCLPSICNFGLVQSESYSQFSDIPLPTSLTQNFHSLVFFD